MKSFADFSDKIRSSKSNKYLLGKSMDYIPDGYNEVCDMIDTFKEQYSDDIQNITIEKGFTTINTINTAHSVNSTNLIGKKKLNKIFPDNKLPDKYVRTIKVIIIYKPLLANSNKVLPNWANDEILDPSSIDDMMSRLKAIKTLNTRVKYHNCELKITFNQNTTISLLLFFNDSEPSL